MQSVLWGSPGAGQTAGELRLSPGSVLALGRIPFQTSQALGYKGLIAQFFGDWAWGLGWDEGECPACVRNPGMARCQDTPGGSKKKNQISQNLWRGSFLFSFCSFKAVKRYLSKCILSDNLTENISKFHLHTCVSVYCRDLRIQNPQWRLWNWSSFYPSIFYNQLSLAVLFCSKCKITQYITQLLKLIWKLKDVATALFKPYAMMEYPFLLVITS